jgi:hypothetical protein
MPYSKDPRSYPPFFTSLIKSFPAAPELIDFILPSFNEATATRVQFYSFIRALESQAIKDKKNGDPGEAKTNRDLAALGRTRQVEVVATHDSTGGWQLLFRSRNSTDTMQSLISQFDAMNLTIDSPFDDLPETETDVSWFDTPLLADFPVGDPDEATDLDGLFNPDSEEKS